MELKEFESHMNSFLKDLEIQLNKTQIEQFYSYMQVLLEWNQKINLTAIIDPKEIVLKHFIDSIVVSKYIPQNSEIVDVGTGAGFPGIPLKIIRKDIHVVLLDSLNKRIQFLNQVIQDLDLRNIETIHARVEEFGKNKQYREHFDIAISRAVANMSTLSEYMLPLVKVNGSAICMKGADFREELKHSQSAIQILGGSLNQIKEYVLPCTDMNRSIIVLEKVKNTPLKYPRKPGTPSKEPLGISGSEAT